MDVRSLLDKKMTTELPAATPVPEPARPTLANERIETLDVIRGFALFGIMFVNVYAFVHPHNWFGVDWQNLSPLEYGAEIFKLLFTQGKFYSLFAILFGIGFAVQLSSAQKRGGPFALRFLWRITILWLFGVAHLLLLWNGDILNSYAVGGVFLLIFYLPIYGTFFFMVL